MVFLSKIRHHPGQMLKREKGNGVNNPHVSRSFLFQLFFYERPYFVWPRELYHWISFVNDTPHPYSQSRPLLIRWLYPFLNFLRRHALIFFQCLCYRLSQKCHFLVFCLQTKTETFKVESNITSSEPYQANCHPNQTHDWFMSLLYHIFFNWKGVFHQQQVFCNE